MKFKYFLFICLFLFIRNSVSSYYSPTIFSNKYYYRTSTSISLGRSSTGITDDLSWVLTNPAAGNLVNGTFNFQLDTSYMENKWPYELTSDSKTTHNISIVFLGMSFKKNKWSINLLYNVNYDLTIKNHIITYDGEKEGISWLRNNIFKSSFGYCVKDNFHIGLGIDYSSYKFLEQDQRGIYWNAYGFKYIIGIIYKINENFIIDFSYDSNLNLYDNPSPFDMIETAVLRESYEFNFPESYRFGVFYQMKKIKLYSNIDYHKFEKFHCDFDNKLNPLPAFPDIIETKDYRSILNLSLGLEFKLNEYLMLRTGVFRNENNLYVYDQYLGKYDYGCTLGIGIKYKTIAFNLGFETTTFLEKESINNIYFGFVYKK